jgi:hypothetical protein
MTAFPAEWQVFEGQEFFTFGAAGAANSGVQLHTLLQIDDSGRSTGLFRLVLEGENLMLAIPTAMLIPGLLEELRALA